MRQIVEECLYAAIEENKAARRHDRRFPFFRSVTISMANDSSTGRPAFIRDISRSGIGLFHSMPLGTGPVMVTIPSLAGHPLNIQAELRWCRPVDEGWYISGGRLLNLSLRQAMSVCAAVFKADYSLRLQQRFPFFRPITIAAQRESAIKVRTFSRDISPDGIGLVHSMPVSPGRVVLGIPSATGRQVDISAEIRWCAPAGQNCYLSGGSFRTLLLEELQTRTL
jgi:hypothetical protein